VPRDALYISSVHHRAHFGPPSQKGTDVVTDPAFRESVAQASDYIQIRLDAANASPRVALILGSGLSILAERARDAVYIPYADIPQFPRSTVPGHAGRLVVGSLAGVDVLIMQGRVHYYEGYSAREVTFPIRVLHSLGIRALCVTNAAGGLHPEWSPGDLMVITDHINLVAMAGHSPLRGPNDDALGPRFPSMVRAYDPEFIELLQRTARAQGQRLRHGVYAMVAGPSFETPAEVRMLRALGADAVGMSTAPEVLVARHAGMRVVGTSLITNIAVDTQETSAEPTHEEVLEAGRLAAPALASLIEGALPQIATSVEQG